MKEVIFKEKEEMNEMVQELIEKIKLCSGKENKTKIIGL